MKKFWSKVYFSLLERKMSLCSATTKKGESCKKRAKLSGFCSVHARTSYASVPVAQSPRCDVLVCTSGYEYDFWQAPEGCTGLYEHNVAKKDRFNVYASQFPCLEINSTYYGNPSESTCRAWKKRAEETGHKYVVKVNKYITHSKKLLDFDETFPRFWRLCEMMGKNVEALLFQFPPLFRNTEENMKRLKAVAKVFAEYEDLPSLCFEFRHPSWFGNKKVSRLFKKQNWTLVLPIAVNDDKKWIGELPEYDIGSASTDSDMVYFRLHGTKGQYIGSYTDEYLQQLAGYAKYLTEKEKKKVVIAFNNTDSVWFHGIPVPLSLDGFHKVAFDKTMSAVYCAKKVMQFLE
ncbi:hypothetical protein GMAR_ORF169 [Golden Marseillevirus]|uniref:hypothetical protein n=1 Tax=Golden Marseillevirus TaxID=1720526 RepID=UPI000877ACAF|nr:hypothetical protein GMAR_ORF169 [Golden Marseillevirus]ALX27543.1 hypothetical protein GMAR_ORF169 [Golden Marseillevirus]